jgi:hypothetical protein
VLSKISSNLGKVLLSTELHLMYQWVVVSLREYNTVEWIGLGDKLHTVENCWHRHESMNWCRQKDVAHGALVQFYN